MARLCGRPGCSAPGSVSYGMVPEDLLFWIEALDDAGTDDLVGVLCRRHADAMVVPRGWTLDDRREPAPRLFRPPSETEADRVRRTPARRPRTDVVSEQLQIDGTGEIERPVEPDTEAVPTTWHPAFDHDDDLGGVLEVRSPLLARAFHRIDRSKDRVDGTEVEPS